MSDVLRERSQFVETFQPWVDDVNGHAEGFGDGLHDFERNGILAALDASDPDQVKALPDADTAIAVLEGISMYLTREELHGFFRTLQEKYGELHVLADVYTVFGAKASKYKNPVNDVGVTQLYGIDDIQDVLTGLRLQCKAEHSFTPARLVDELKPADRIFFKMMFTGKSYGKIYRLYELETAFK